MTDDVENIEQVGHQPEEEILTDQYVDLPLEEQVTALRQDLEESQKQVERSREMIQRSQAELVNYKRRADDDRIAAQQYSNSRLIIKMLPVIDELELAISHASNAADNSSGESWWEGVRLIQRKVSGMLESEGVVKIEIQGQMFDPLQHEALGTRETSEYPPGYIVEVVRNGYRLHERVIQPAQVVVAKQVQQPKSGSD